MSKEDILLRETVNPPLATKGSPLDFTELDANFITIYNQFVLLSQSSQVPAYSPAIEYSINEYVSYSSQLWRMINGVPQTDVTPGTDPLTWIAVYASDMVQAPLINGAKIYEFEKLILSADVLTMGVTDTLIEILPALGVGLAPQFLGGTVTVQNVGGFPYDINTSIHIAPANFDLAAGRRAFELINILQATTFQSMAFTPSVIAYSPAVDQLPTNTPIMAGVAGGNPSGGSSDILIKGTYKILDFN